jgi:hypothetical protein
VRTSGPTHAQRIDARYREARETGPVGAHDVPQAVPQAAHYSRPVGLGDVGYFAIKLKGNAMLTLSCTCPAGPPTWTSVTLLVAAIASYALR